MDSVLQSVNDGIIDGPDTAGDKETRVAVLERPCIKLDIPWITIVWNDPVNLMSYVSYVFRKVFGYSKEKADSLMREVHFQGKAVVASGPRHQMEASTAVLQEYGLWATFQRSDR